MPELICPGHLASVVPLAPRRVVCYIQPEQRFTAFSNGSLNVPETSLRLQRHLTPYAYSSTAQIWLLVWFQTWGKFQTANYKVHLCLTCFGWRSQSHNGVGTSNIKYILYTRVRRQRVMLQRVYRHICMYSLQVSSWLQSVVRICPCRIVFVALTGFLKTYAS